MADPLRAFLYARNSRDAGREHRSTDDQLTEGRQDCERQGWVIVDEFVDVGHSASRHARRRRGDFDDMVARVEAGECDVLVAWESSRLQRDLEVYVTLRNLCARTRVLWSLNGRLYDMTNRQDRFVTGLDALRAEDEADGIRDRVLRTTRLYAQRGWPHGRLPYGFRREYDPDKGHLLGQVADPDQAPILREIIRRIASGESCTAIAADLTARGIPTQHGSPVWHRTVVREIALHPANIGLRVYYDTTVPAKWEPIVDRAEYMAAAAILRDPARRNSRESALRHLLSSVAVCGTAGCGRRMEPASPNHASPQYRCRNGHATIGRALLDAYVTEAALQWLERADVAALIARRGGDDQVREAMARAEEYRQTLSAARERVGLPGGLSIESMAALESNLRPLIAAADKQAEVTSFPALVIEMAGPEARSKWTAAEIPIRRALLRHIVRPAVMPGGRGVRTIRPGRVVLTWPLDGGAPGDE
ncbi:recombinase family protein [Embleya sp. NPDC050154]|uniref:recombinase family protein n=1 Tax=Embleya sp. NPDC050154 TaxID=3363988 RepID=UPI0037B934E5